MLVIGWEDGATFTFRWRGNERVITIAKFGNVSRDNMLAVTWVGGSIGVHCGPTLADPCPPVPHRPKTREGGVTGGARVHERGAPVNSYGPPPPPQFSQAYMGQIFSLAVRLETINRILEMENQYLEIFIVSGWRLSKNYLLDLRANGGISKRLQMPSKTYGSYYDRWNLYGFSLAKWRQFFDCDTFWSGSNFNKNIVLAVNFVFGEVSYQRSHGYKPIWRESDTKLVPRFLAVDTRSFGGQHGVSIPRQRGSGGKNDCKMRSLSIESRPPLGPEFLSGHDW